MNATPAPQPAGTPEPAGAPAAPALGGRDYLRLVLLGLAIGIPAALAALLFQWLVHELEKLLWTALPEALGLDSPPWYLLVGLPVIGALIVWFARTRLPGDGGHEPLQGIGGGAMPLAYAPGVLLAALGSLPFGAVLGPEAPLIAIGGFIGMVAVRMFRVQGPGGTVLSTAGSFSAISALFGGPIVAGAILLEAGLAAGAMLIPVLLPGMVAAAVGYLLIVGIGSWSGLPPISLSVPDLPAYPNARIVDLVLAVVAGVVIAVVIRVVRVAAFRVKAARPRFGVGPVLLIGGAAGGAVAAGVAALGGAYQDVLFSGQEALPDLLSQESLGLVALILAGKVIAFALFLGAGFRGGPIFPAVFIGTGVAILVGAVADMPATVALAIGTAAGMTAMSRLIFSSLVFVVLLVGSGGAAAMPAAVLAAATAWLVMRTLDARMPEPAPDDHAPAPA
jgi:H+/Cl- antiporter ClcA